MQMAADESQSLLHLTIGYAGRFFVLKRQFVHCYLSEI